MKTLVDTCVWSLALRRRNKARLNPEEQGLVAQLTEIIQDGNIAMIGPIRQEVLSGIKDESQFAKTAQLLEPFPDEELRAEDYVHAARLFNLCRSRGVQCGPIDMLICAVASQRSYPVLTNDQGLLRCLEILRKSRVFSAQAGSGNIQ